MTTITNNTDVNMKTPVMADLSTRGDRIDVRFPYDRALVTAVKTIPGARFVPADKADGPCWRLPLDMESGRALRRAIPHVQLTPELAAWGRTERDKQARLQELSNAASGALTRLPAEHPELYAWIAGRPYQTADVAFMATQHAAINANAPGLGKTVETIGAVYEAGRGLGRHLVIAGITSMDAVWGDQLRRWVPNVIVAKGTPQQRQAALDSAAELIRQGQPVWVVVNPAMVQLVAEYERDSSGQVAKPKREISADPRFPSLFDITWDTIVVDEFHQQGLGNTKTLTRRGLKLLRGENKITLSGTPIGGKPIKLWGVLNYLHPQIFTSKWTWAERWLEMDENRYASSGKTITDRIIPGKEEEFVKYHSQFMIRRTREEVMADLPARNVIDVWCELEGEQAAQYEEFNAEVALTLEDETVTATGILAEFTRLRQLAGSICDIANGNLRPTGKGAKLDQLLRILADHGLAEEREGEEKAIVFSQFTGLINAIAPRLLALGLDVRVITGQTAQEERTAAVSDFEAGRVDVLLMNTKAGGTALTLNRSNLIVFLDETWNPDDQEQAESRNRNNNADIYYIRATGTIEEAVYGLTGSKTTINKTILDTIRRSMA